MRQELETKSKWTAYGCQLDPEWSANPDLFGIERARSKELINKFNKRQRIGIRKHIERHAEKFKLLSETDKLPELEFLTQRLPAIKDT